VLSMTWAPNQARTLQALHSVKVDDGTILSEGTEVSYTDTDLGYCFLGKIVEVKKNYEAGEGVTYVCADAYRTFAKQPAKIACPAGTTYKLHFNEGTLFSDVLTKVLSSVTGVIPGGVTNSLAATAMPLLDKAGQSVDAWISDMLSSTAGGVAYINPNAGSPKLDIIDFYASPTVDLNIGSYTPITPASGNPMLLERGSFGKSLNRKYKKITIEGSGMYRRYQNKYLNAQVVEVNPTAGVWQIRWYISDKYLMKRYIQDDGTCANAIKGKIMIGEEPDGRMVDFNDMSYGYDDVEKRWFFWAIISLVGPYIGPLPVPPHIRGWFDYTVYEGSFLYTKTSPSATLDNEGEIVEFHPEFFRYISDTLTIDHTALVTTLVDALYEKWSGDPDQSGSITVHVKGVNANLIIGSAISNFSGMRVRQIGYDFVARSMQLEVSNLPVRENIDTLKMIASLQRNQAGGWRTAKGGNENNCFQNYQFTVDEDCRIRVPSIDGKDDSEHGGDARPSTPSDPNQGGSWACMPDGSCQHQEGVKGMTEAECRAQCPPGDGWKFIPCNGCNQVNDGTGPYPTEAECNIDHPNPLQGCKWICMPDQTYPNQCQAVENGGVYDTQNDCFAVCFPKTGSGSTSGAGSGGVSGSGFGSGANSGFPSGSGSGFSDKVFMCSGSGYFVKAITTDFLGRVKSISCDQGGAATSGHTGLVYVVCGLECASGSTQLTIKYTDLDYVNGILVGCTSDCPDGCDGAL